MYYADVGELTSQLRAEVEDVLLVQDVSHQDGDQVRVFAGEFLQDTERAYSLVHDRFGRYGYVPFFRRKRGRDQIIAVPAPTVREERTRLWVNVLLFVVTIFTTLYAGAVREGVDPLRNPFLLLHGFPFAFTLLAILGTHELGHYLMGRRRGLAVTLPYFIPVPFGLGTFGAFIKMKSLVRDRKALFDVGLAGPVAGLMVAFPLLLLGLGLSRVRPLGATPFGYSILMGWLVKLIHGSHPKGWVLEMHPIAWAGWIGLLVTGVNLLPVGQLDGGHVAYALLGQRHRLVAGLTFLVVLGMGFALWPGWFTWAALMFLTGLRHPPPLNDLTMLDPLRKVLGLTAFFVLILIITPVPIKVLPGTPLF